jgi:hypothetical protein
MLVVALLAAGCNDAPKIEPAPPPDTAGGRPDVSRPEIAPSVNVTIGDTAISVSQGRIKSVGTGQVSVAVVNKSKATQAFTIKGGALGTWTSTPISPGQAVLMSQLMDRGTYELVWPGPPEIRNSIVIY